MKFGKLVLLGALLSATVPAALATTITGVLNTNSSGGGGAAVNPANVNFQSSYTGTETSSTGAFSGIPAGTAVTYLNNATGATTNFLFTDVSAATPVLFETITSNGITYQVFLTAVTNSTTGTVSRAGVFNATGYITGTGSDATAVTVNLSSTTAGAGRVPFTATVTAAGVAAFGITPEPSSLTLLGTGIMSAAGMAYRRRRIL